MYRALVVAVLALAPAGRAAPVPKHLMPKEEPLFLSVRVGDRFVLVHNGQEFVTTIKAVERAGGGYKVVQSGKRPDGTVVEQTMAVSPAGVRTVRYDGQDYDEPHEWLRLPHVANNKWTSKAGGATVYHYRTVDWEDLDLPYGKVRALRVERTTGGANAAVGVYYWAHGLGCVKWSYGGEGRELKAYLPAAGPAEAPAPRPVGAGRGPKAPIPAERP